MYGQKRRPTILKSFLLNSLYGLAFLLSGIALFLAAFFVF